MNDVVAYLLLCLSAFAGGVVNAVAGGGTLLTFPSLLAVLSPLSANVTSTVALVPGSFAGAWGYRKELAGAGPWLRLLLLPSLAGGTVGSLLLIWLPESFFAEVIPWLLLTASLLFLSQPLFNRLFARPTSHTLAEEALPSASRQAVICLFQFLVGVYGGYFGAGIGILTLSALGLMGLHDIHRMNAVKTVLATSINAVSVFVFLFSGQVHWGYGLGMALAAIAGGYTGARTGRRLPKTLVRWIVVLIGLAMAAYYFVR